ncbi:MAG: SRPBCC domain-containing protein [Albidovulum sp.]|nr:SRPBCC domain-containing protein [Albidovulum sp.]MDE0534002.1 SRPBCC domain-containing protein [Albidovulum sp.]
MPTDEITAKAQILIRRPRNEVFNAFMDPAVMSKFWLKRKDKGLREGDKITWFVGDASDAFEIEVRVMSIKQPSQIKIEWGQDGQFTTVTWTLDEQNPDVTRLVIEERGFIGTRDEVVSQALDSTGGFNQVIVALKALLEHNSTINVVADRV